MNNINIKSSFETVLDYMKANMPVDLRKLCNDLDIELSYVTMDDDISGEIECRKDGSFAINVNKNHHPNRQRFTIAHELGHFIHHRSLIGDGIDDNKAYRSVNQGKYFNQNISIAHEREANTFAASLLMPKEMVAKCKHEHMSTIDMAEYFKVSQAAMSYRLQGLGI
ncbi:ImmA/IrrE family metallo-endopeptidase [Aliivibrio fischeri]|uniref:ImmA/IrrE family metallo-endopeptidase n=1 Tax=Aliivibrio fischeri TaxID=668 RepID=UPI0018C783FC|nr:ImmA/IrrE family metallo-endopeptidase [Aliivibrio fischeri]